MMPQPRSVPTIVSGAGAGWAQPLAQPDTCTAMPMPGRCGCRAISAASARAAIKPDTHAGLPGHATIRRRGSSACTMKSSRSASRASASALGSDNPISNNARPGAGRSARAPCAAAASARSSNARACVWPKASASPSANASPRSGCSPMISAGGRRGGGASSGRTGSAARNAAIPSVRRTSAARPSRCAAMIRSTAKPTSAATATGTDPSGVAVAASPASATCNRVPSSVANARKRRSAVSASRWNRPPASTITDTLWASVIRASPIAARTVCPMAAASTSAAGSSPSGSVMTETPSMATPSSATAAANNGADASVRPRTCRLPRALTSIVPLPCRAAARQNAASAAGAIRSAGAMRASSPSPVCIGVNSAGHAPRRSALIRSGMLSALSKAHGREQFADIVAARVPEAKPAGSVEPLRDGARRVRVLALEERPHRVVGEIGIIHEIEQGTVDRGGRVRERDQAVDGLGEFGGAAEAVAHLAGDEARVDAAAHKARQRRAERARAWPLRVGRIEHDQVDNAAEGPGRRRKAADESGVLGALEQIAAGIIARVQQQFRRRDPVRELAGQGGAAAVRSAIAVRGRGEIRGADARAIGIAREQFLDAGAVGAGGGAEDARDVTLAAASRGRERVLLVALVARGRRPYRRVDERDLARKEVAEEAGDTERDVDARAPDCGGRQHLDAGDPRGRRVPDRPAAHEPESLGNLLAPGAQGRAAPEVDHQGARHLAMGLQVVAQDLLGREAAEIERGLRGQRARVGGEEVAAGREHVAASARRRARRPGRDPAPVERGNEAVALRGGAQIPCRISDIALYRQTPIHVQAVLDGEVLKIAQPSVDLAQGGLGARVIIYPGFG